MNGGTRNFESANISSGDGHDSARTRTQVPHDPGSSLLTRRGFMRTGALASLAGAAVATGGIGAYASEAEAAT
ncbi:MAG: hypothetical protein EPN41_06870, partial [Candidimonas sp.]